MDGMAILAIWFASVIAGMVLTMIMPKLFADTRGNGAYQGEAAWAPSHEITHVEVLQGGRASMGLVEDKV